MSWDCQHKLENNQCDRLKKECSPGKKGCVLHGKFAFPDTGEDDENENEETI